MFCETIVFSRETTEKPKVENIIDLSIDNNIWYDLRKFFYL